MEDNTVKLLNENISACSERVGSLIYTFNKNQSLFPLDDASGDLSEDQKESLDALF